MRLVTVFVSFLTLVATGVLAVATVKLRRDLADTRRDLAALRDSRRAEPEGFAWAEGDEGSPAPGRAPQPAAVTAPRLAPAALAPGPASPPAAPPSLASPEAKAEVKKLVAEQLADEQQRREAVREQREQQRRERLAAELGLAEGERARFLAVLAATQAEWRQLREQERTGEKTLVELRPQMETARQKGDQALRELLGDERMQKYQALRANPRGAGPGSGQPPIGPGGP